MLFRPDSYCIIIVILPLHIHEFALQGVGWLSTKVSPFGAVSSSPTGMPHPHDDSYCNKRNKTTKLGNHGPVSSWHHWRYCKSWQVWMDHSDICLLGMWIFAGPKRSVKLRFLCDIPHIAIWNFHFAILTVLTPYYVYVYMTTHWIAMSNVVFNYYINFISYWDFTKWPPYGWNIPQNGFPGRPYRSKWSLNVLGKKCRSLVQIHPKR